MNRITRTTPEQVAQNLGDLDKAIFELLPDEGSKLGFSPRYASVRYLAGEVNKQLEEGAPLVSAGSLSARMRFLRLGGFTVPVSTRLSGNIDGWQRTARATAWLQEREEN